MLETLIFETILQKVKKQIYYDHIVYILHLVTVTIDSLSSHSHTKILYINNIVLLPHSDNNTSRNLCKSFNKTSIKKVLQLQPLRTCSYILLSCAAEHKKVANSRFSSCYFPSCIVVHMSQYASYAVFCTAVL